MRISTSVRLGKMRNEDEQEIVFHRIQFIGIVMWTRYFAIDLYLTVYLVTLTPANSLNASLWYYQLHLYCLVYY